MGSNKEFLDFISELKASVSHVDTLPTTLTSEDTYLTLKGIAGIGAAVRDAIDLYFPDKNMDDDSCAAVVELEGILLRLRGEARVRLAAIQEFEKMTHGASVS